jgi:hypothetical protein
VRGPPRTAIGERATKKNAIDRNPEELTPENPRNSIRGAEICGNERNGAMNQDRKEKSERKPVFVLHGLKITGVPRRISHDISIYLWEVFRVEVQLGSMSCLVLPTVDL